MNIEQIKQQYAELAELDKKRTQGEWRASDVEGYFNNMPDIYQVHWSADGECVAEIVHGKGNTKFIAQAPTMFKMIGELIARVETLEARLKEIEGEDKEFKESLQFIRGENRKIKANREATND